MWEQGANRSIDVPQLELGEVVVYELPQAYFPIYPWKGAGTVVPIFSLRSEGSFGVGDFGDLKLMIDWIAKTQQRILQVLPINDTNITHTWQDSYSYNSILKFITLSGVPHASQIVPTGISFVPPPGPARPVAAIA